MNHTIAVYLHEGSLAPKLAKAISRVPSSVRYDQETGRADLTFSFVEDKATAQETARAIAAWFKETGAGGMLFIHSSMTFEAKAKKLPTDRSRSISSTGLRALPGGKKVR